MDQYTRTETVGWFERIIQSIKGVLVGLLVFVVSFPLLFWNEGRAVRRAQDLTEGRGAVVEASAATVDPAQEGRLVHLTGAAVSSATPSDPELGPAAPGGLRLRRVVEMFQWHEDRRTSTSSNTGGSQTRRTTITYRKDWSTTPVDSSRFDQPREHFNPAMPVQGASFDAPTVTVGARALTPALVAQISNFRPLPVAPAQLPAVAAWGRPVHAWESGVHVGGDVGAPSVGDLRLRWEVAPAGEVSVLAAQRGGTFGDWTTPSGRTLEQDLSVGAVSAAGMFTSLETGNVVLTWVLRFLGWLMMFAGISMVTRPLVIVADVIPLIGSVVGAGTGLFALLVSAPLTLMTIALGWLAYRPLLGVGLLVAGAGVAFLVGRLAVDRGRAANVQRAAQRAAHA